MVETRGPQLTAVLAIFLTLTWLFTGLRVYVRWTGKNWGADDSLLLTALGCFTAYTVCSLVSVKYGTGTRIKDIPPDHVPTALMYYWICELLFIWTTFFVRLSISLFLIRICVKKLHKRIVYATISVVLIFSVPYFFLVIFACNPVSHFWMQYAGAKGSCLAADKVLDSSYAHGALCALSDWTLGLLPIWLIWNLKMNARTKTAIGILLSLGVIAGFASIIRVRFTRVLATTNDPTYYLTDPAIWATTEIGLGITAAGACMLRPLFKALRAGSKSGSQRTQNPIRLSTWDVDRGPYGPNSKTGSSVHHTVKRMVLGKEAEISMVNNAHNPGSSLVSTQIHGLRKGSGSSEEELTGKLRGGIQVERTVEIRREDGSISDQESHSHG